MAKNFENLDHNYVFQQYRISQHSTLILLLSQFSKQCLKRHWKNWNWKPEFRYCSNCVSTIKKTKFLFLNIKRIIKYNVVANLKEIFVLFRCSNRWCWKKYSFSNSCFLLSSVPYACKRFELFLLQKNLIKLWRFCKKKKKREPKLREKEPQKKLYLCEYSIVLLFYPSHINNRQQQ